MARNRQQRKPVESAVEMAIAAVENNPLPSPLDQDMSAVDPSPGSLDLVLPGKPDNQPTAESGAAHGGVEGQSVRRKKRPAVTLRPQS